MTTPKRYSLPRGLPVLNETPVFGDSAADLTLLDDIIASAAELKHVNLTPKNTRVVRDTASTGTTWTMTGSRPHTVELSPVSAFSPVAAMQSEESCQPIQKESMHPSTPNTSEYTAISFSSEDDSSVEYNARRKIGIRGLPIVEIMLPLPPPVLDGSPELGSAEQQSEEGDGEIRRERTMVGWTFDAVTFVLGSIILAPWRLFVRGT